MSQPANVIKFPNSPYTPEELVKTLIEDLPSISKMVVLVIREDGYDILHTSTMDYPNLCMAARIFDEYTGNMLQEEYDV